MAVSGHAATIFVNASAAAGGDGSSAAPFQTIQEGLNLAVAGDTVSVATGVYRQKLVFPRSGSAGLSITLLAEGTGVVIDGTNRVGRHVILINGKSHITIRGFRIRNNAGSRESSLLRVVGKGDGINIARNRFTRIDGNNVSAISVLGTSGTDAIRDLRIHDNVIQDVEAGTRAGILLSGNVVDFDIDDNLIRNIDGAGIALQGGYDVTGNNDADRARLGKVRRNLIENCSAEGDAEFVAGISIDGGASNVIERNDVAGCDFGIELTAEKSAAFTKGNIVRENDVLRNTRAGVVIGADDGDDGKVRSNRVSNNDLFANATSGDDLGEVVFRFARRNDFVKNRVETAQASNFLVFSEETNANIGNTSNRNIFFSPAGRNDALFMWQGVEYVGFRDYQEGSGQDGNSVFRNTAL